MALEDNIAGGHREFVPASTVLYLGVACRISSQKPADQGRVTRAGERELSWVIVIIGCLWASVLAGANHTFAQADQSSSVGLRTQEIQPSSVDSVIVESKSVVAGATDVIVGIRITNSASVMGLTVPLEFRAITPGAFITRVALGYRERLTDQLTSVRFANHYAERDGICQDSRAPGYKNVTASEVNWRVPVTGSPWGVLFSAFRYPPGPSLSPGSDTSGSLTLRFDVTSRAGTFEIDTSCVYPSTHLLLVAEVAGGGLAGITPVFEKGVITITPCACPHHGDVNGDGSTDGLDYSRLIDHVFFGDAAPAKDTSCPHTNRGDVNCDGAADIRDILHVREHLYGAGLPPCDPCACHSYPSDCP